MFRSCRGEPFCTSQSGGGEVGSDKNESLQHVKRMYHWAADGVTLTQPWSSHPQTQKQTASHSELFSGVSHLLHETPMLWRVRGIWKHYTQDIRLNTFRTDITHPRTPTELFAFNPLRKIYARIQSYRNTAQPVCCKKHRCLWKIHSIRLPSELASNICSEVCNEPHSCARAVWISFIPALLR